MDKLSSDDIIQVGEIAASLKNGFEEYQRNDIASLEKRVVWNLDQLYA